MLELQAYIQTHLEADLSLHALAQRTQQSAFSLHRAFKQATGTTLAKYVAQARLTRAAHALVFQQSKVLDLALELGYQNHETFSRAFKRLYGCSPKDYRASGNWLQRPQPAVLDKRQQGPYQLSATRPQLMRDIRIAYVRYAGDYTQVPESIWAELTSELANQQVAWGQFLGVAHDDPRRTPAGQCRYDAAVIVPANYQGNNGINTRTFSPGHCAITYHLGPYGTLGQALPQVYAQTAGIDGFAIQDLPLVEIYHTKQMDVAAPLNYTSIVVNLTKIKPVDRSSSHIR